MIKESDLRVMNSENPICPNCGSIDKTWTTWIDGEEEGFKHICPMCSKEYSGACVTKYTFFTERRPNNVRRKKSR